MNALETAKYWSENKLFDQNTRKETKNILKKNDPLEIEELFGRFLDFGTGGLRGKMGVGTNRINNYTIQMATEGLARIIEKNFISNGKNKVVVGYDNRNNSLDFAIKTCEVLLAHKLKVFLFKNISPTPLVSCEIIRQKAVCGIIITASHNPPEYNGYKVYWETGGQIVPPIDDQIINEVKKIRGLEKIKQISFAEGKNKKNFFWIDKESDQNYLNSVRALSLGKKKNNNKLGLIFSPLHGTGGRLVPKLLKLQGFSKLKLVANQMKPDGNFGTLSSPNPEDISSYKMSLRTATIEDELILVNDPDADRLGVMVRDSNKHFQFLSGNQIGVLLLEHILLNLKGKNLLTEKNAIITTFVSTPLIKVIAKEFKLKVLEVLTGFKWVKQAALNFEKDNGGKFVFAMEESNGYLMGNHSGDKDGVWAAMAFAEMNAELKSQNLTPIDKLNQIYKKYGTFMDKLETKTFQGKTGLKRISEIVSNLRNSNPLHIGGEKVLKVTDLLNRKIKWIEKNKVTKGPNLPISNVISFELSDGSRIIVRPSGTEPKIKYYFNLRGENNEILNNKFLEMRDSIVAKD